MTGRKLSFTAFLMVVGVVAVPGEAAAQSGSQSSAFGESVSLNLLPLLGSPVTVTSGPLPSVEGSGPPSYSVSATAASVSVSAGSLGTGLSTGILTVDANGLTASPENAEADATVDNLHLELAAVVSVLGLSAATVSSTTTVTCTGGLQSTTGTTTVTDPKLTALGARLNIPLQPAPNTVLFDAAGLRIVLNEQIRTFDGTALNLVVNAIDITLDAVPSGIGALSGQILIAQSQAQQSCLVLE